MNLHINHSHLVETWTLSESFRLNQRTYHVSNVRVKTEKSPRFLIRLIRKEEGIFFQILHMSSLPWFDLIFRSLRENDKGKRVSPQQHRLLTFNFQLFALLTLRFSDYPNFKLQTCTLPHASSLIATTFEISSLLSPISQPLTSTHTIIKPKLTSTSPLTFP